MTAKYYVSLLDKLKHSLLSKREDKSSKETLFLRGNGGLHKAAIKALQIARFSL
jgi:hypothetical protein